MAIFLTNWEGAAGATAAHSLVSSGSAAIEIIVAALKQAESDRNAPTVGAHGYPNILGQVELDASLMDGDTLLSGAVGALSGYAHPIAVAREVMLRLPHVLVVGEGAGRFAEECGAEPAPPLTAEQKRFLAEFKESLPAEINAQWPPPSLAPLASMTGFAGQSKGTAIFLVRDRQRQIASGATTSGWPLKYPGRLGDSPIVGAGHYCHSKHGAAACTHTGEMTIRCATARSIVLYLKQGMTPREACHEALADLRELRGGTLGPVVLHAINAADEHFVLSTGPMKRFWMWRDGMSAPEEVEPEIAPL